MKVLDLEFDTVINGSVAIGYSSYNYAFDNLIPLINKTDFQRKLQDRNFYKKLERDIEDGCVMPPITIAFITQDINRKSNIEETSKYIDNNIQNAFVLDGIQRLNTLSRLKESKDLDKEKKLYINHIFCDSVEKLLYRMITLNNGQRPMTPRHQVEAMMANVYDFDDLGLTIQTEKEGASQRNIKAFKKADIIQAYLAFMANSPIVDNKKIIQDKMDDLLVNKIISGNPLEYDARFKDMLKALSKFQGNPQSLKWLKVVNNLVGLAVGMRKSSDSILKLSLDEFVESIELFEGAFKKFDPSTIKVGKFRRELSSVFFTEFDTLKSYDSDDLLQYFSDITSD